MNGRIAGLIAAALLLGACTDFTGGSTFTCNTQAPTRTGMRGDTVTTQIGLMYIDSIAGTGALLEACQQATVDFDLYRTDGMKFDSSTVAQPLTFVAGAGRLNILGVDVGVIGMKVGGVRRLIVPPELAFGDREYRSSTGEVILPPNSTIIADVTLRSVGAKQGQP